MVKTSHVRYYSLFSIGTDSSLTVREMVLLAVTGFFGILVVALVVTVVVLGLMLYKKNSEFFLNSGILLSDIYTQGQHMQEKKMRLIYAIILPMELQLQTKRMFMLKCVNQLSLCTLLPLERCEHKHCSEIKRCLQHKLSFSSVILVFTKTIFESCIKRIDQWRGEGYFSQPHFSPFSQ